MKSIINQALIIVVLSAIAGGVLNLIRADRVPWIFQDKIFQDSGRSVPDSLADYSGSPYPRLVLIDRLDQLRDGGAIIIDARLPEFYSVGHIPGAINIPFENLNPYLKSLFAIPKDANVVIYCDGGDCELAYDLALYMIQRGFLNIFEYQAGWAEWIAAGRPIATGVTP